MEEVGGYIRDINKLWTEQKPYADDCPTAQRHQALIDAFHMVRVAVTLLHPVAPTGTEKVREQFGLGPELFDWSRIFDGLDKTPTRWPSLCPPTRAQRLLRQDRVSNQCRERVKGLDPQNYFTHKAIPP